MGADLSARFLMGCANQSHPRGLHLQENAVLPQPERGFLADMQVFTQTQKIPEGGEVAGQRPCADAAAQLHGALLARGAARPVAPFHLCLTFDAVGGIGKFGKLCRCEQWLTLMMLGQQAGATH